MGLSFFMEPLFLRVAAEALEALVLSLLPIPTTGGHVGELST